MTKNKSPLRHLLSGAGIQLVTMVVSAVIGFFLTPILIHTLGDRDYGLLELVGSFAGWLGLVDFGLSGAVTRFVAIHFARGDQKESLSYGITAFYLYLALGLLALLLAVLGSLCLPRLLSNDADVPLVRILLILAAISFTIDMPLRALSGLLNGYMRRDITGWLFLLSKVLRAGAIVVILFLGGRLLALSMTSLILTTIVAMLWFVTTKIVIPGFRISPRLFNSSRARSLLNFGGVSFMGQLAEMMISRIDGFVIAWFIAIAAVPHYMIAVTLTAYFSMTMVALTGWLINWFAHKDATSKDAVNESLYLSTRYCVIVGGFCTFGLIAFGRPFIERWMGPDYLDAYPCLVALSIAEFFRAFQRPNMNLLYAKAQHHVFAINKMIEAVLNLILSIALVRGYGILGVALGTMLASIAVNGVLFPMQCCRITQTSSWQYTVTSLHGLSVFALSILVPVWLAISLTKPNYASLVFAGLLSALAYFPFALLLGATRLERKRIIASLIG